MADDPKKNNSDNNDDDNDESSEMTSSTCSTSSSDSTQPDFDLLEPLDDFTDDEEESEEEYEDEGEDDDDDEEEINMQEFSGSSELKRKAYVTRGSEAIKKRRKIDNMFLASPPFIPKTLIELIELCKLSQEHIFKDCQALDSLLHPLQKLNAMIGLTDIKQKVVDMVLLRAQKRNGLSLPKMAHIVLTGPPGSGKSTFITILAEILKALGDVDGKIVHARADQCIGKYLGQTESQTFAMCQSSVGGILVLDEITSFNDGEEMVGTRLVIQRSLVIPSTGAYLNWISFALLAVMKKRLIETFFH